MSGMRVSRRSGGRSREWWHVVVREISLSEEDVPTSCKARGISVQSYYYWRKKFSKEDSLPSSSPVSQSFTVVPLSVDSEIVIESRSGHRIVVRGEVSSRALSTVLSCVEAER